MAATPAPVFGPPPQRLGKTTPIAARQAQRREQAAQASQLVVWWLAEQLDVVARCVQYATLLSDVLRTDPEPILGPDRTTLPLIAT